MTSTTYTGGAFPTAGNWTNGRPTSTGNAGLMDGANGWGSGGADYHIRMTGGTINANGSGTGDWAMQGGANGTSSIIEIDDTNSSLVFTVAGRFTMWNNPAITGSTGNELNMLNGEISIGEFWANGGAVARVAISNGTVNAAALATNQANAVVTMKAGGTGAFNVGDIISAATMGQMTLNFETGSDASFTIDNIAGGSAKTYWADNFSVGDVQIDGTNVASFAALEAAFNITDLGLNGTSLSLIPEPGTYALLAGCFALASVMIRRRR